jgi:dsRNA-specific ribonuclease
VLSYSFVFISHAGSQHNPIFYCRAKVNGHTFPEGSGSTKKQAETEAAYKVLEDKDVIINLSIAAKSH